MGLNNTLYCMLLDLCLKNFQDMVKIHTKSDNYKDNYNDKYNIVHTNGQYYHTLQFCLSL